MRLKHTVGFSVGGLWGDEPCGDEDDVRVVRVADFRYDSLTVSDEIPTVRSVPAQLRRIRLLHKGDLLIEKSGGGEQQNVGRVVRWKRDELAICSNFINVLRPAPAFDSSFLAYLHRSLYVSGHAASCTKQTTGIQNLDLSAYLSIGVELPTAEEQAAVATFLDQECARIDELRNELADTSEASYAGYLEALRGLVLDSRFPRVPLKYYAKTGTGHTPSRGHPEYWIEDELSVPWFTLADVHQIRDGRHDVVTDTAEKISERGLANSSAVRHPAGTVLLSRTASVGFSAIMGVEMATSQDFMTWTCGPKLKPRYLLLALRAMQPELRGLMHGSTHQTIYMPELHALRVPLPSLDDQQQIFDKADALARSTWPLVDELDATHSLLADYRDSLITEAVTGQLDVTRLTDRQMGESLDAVLHGERPEVLTR